MSTFPPIADYAFLSDCEVSALVAPDGSVEWMCLPRPDSPSLFGSLLDRSAGFFRFGPLNSSVPDQRRYVPGTMVLETTWHTPTGWMTIEDLLVVGPAENNERLARYQRVPGDSFPQGTLLRIATCYSGRVGVQLDCLPLFEYGTTAGDWSYEGTGYDRLRLKHGDLSLAMESSIRLGTGGVRAYGRTMLHEGEFSLLCLLPSGEQRAFQVGKQAPPKGN